MRWTRLSRGLFVAVACIAAGCTIGEGAEPPELPERLESLLASENVAYGEIECSERGEDNDICCWWDNCVWCDWGSLGREEVHCDFGGS